MQLDVMSIENRIDCYRTREFRKFAPDVNGNTIGPLSNSPMKIVIPTLGRESKQKVIYQIAPSLLQHTFLATKKSHVAELHKNNPKFQILELPDETDGIADTRQRCLDLLPKGKVWMMDDIIKLQTRNYEFRVLGHASYEEVEIMYDTISHFLDFYTQVGISDRPGNNRVRDWCKTSQRSYTCYGLRTDVFENIGIGFDNMYRKNPEIKLFEDFYLTLSLLTRGYENLILYDFVSSHPGHQAKGGNSLYRTEELQRHCLEALQREFPQFVKLDKVSSSWGKGMEGERTEARISWKKAFESSQVKIRTLF